MAVSIKTGKEIELMRTAGKILGEVLEQLSASVKPGMSTKEVDAIGERLIRSRGCVPACLNYCGYPASICVSVNEEVVHGIPSRKRILKEGDLVSLDTVLIYKGYHADACRSLLVGGSGTPEAEKLLKVTQEAFWAGIAHAQAGSHLHDISNAIADYAEGFGYGVIRDYIGHGIGRHMHEDPEVPNYRQMTRGIRLRPGMTIAVEPMIAQGSWKVRVLDDGWTAVTEDGGLAAHYENTILITDAEPEILTLPSGRL